MFRHLLVLVCLVSLYSNAVDEILQTGNYENIKINQTENDEEELVSGNFLMSRID
jgi:hypothetical protein